MASDDNTNDGNVTNGPFQGKPQGQQQSKFDQLLSSVNNDLAKATAESVKAKVKAIQAEIAKHEQAIRQQNLLLDDIRAKFEAGLPI